MPATRPLRLLAPFLLASVLSPLGAQLHHREASASAAAVPADTATAPAPMPNHQLADKQLNGRVEVLLKQMTLAEKVGQLVQYTGGVATGPGTGREDYDSMISKGEIGSLLNVFGAAKVNHYQRLAMEKSRLKIPLLFGYDVIHGDHTIFPVPLALAATFDPTLVEQTARTAAAEARADGVNWVFSPMVDIARDARWGRIVESAGEDPYLGSAMARAYVRGYQGTDLSQPTSVAACIKHFAAYGAPVAGRDYNAVDMSEINLRQNYLPPYKAGIDAGAATVMSSFNSLNGVPASADPFTLTQVLRKEWGFKGMVDSDYGAIGELLKHSIAADGATAAKKALTAGVDMDMESNLYRTRLIPLVQSGELQQSVVDEAVRRILRVKFAMSLFEHPYADEKAPAYQATPEKRALARKAAEESFVLLKNDAVTGKGHLLPLAKTGGTVALIGPLADSKEDMLGSWAASGEASDAVTLREALSSRLGAGKVLYVKGTDVLSEDTHGFAEAVAGAKKADVVVVALGESGPTMSGEASSRTRLELPGNQEDLLKAVVATGKPVVLVLFDGRPTAIPWEAQHIPAILEAWFPGIEAGPAIVDTLFGESNPSGRLPVEFPYDAGQEPLYLAQLPTGRPAGDTDLTHPPTNSEEKYLSRYIDTPNAPVYPFGWGLSYAQFKYSPVKIEHMMGSSTQVGQIHVTAEVQNAGSTAGSEVVQLYIRNRNTSVEQPVRELKRFERVTLAPGETRHLDYTLGFDDLAFYNVDLKRVVEPSDVDLWVGGSSAATETGSVAVMK